ncbi:MAG: hypothetical protein A2Z43_08915 [Syntrophobacterales bacterium RBG_19FT_COMBO_59_10]|nr:MAG: hypothetical protein A2Z43_08915 [Syntrophobacterales bacterium RBG_19FT_COMBO_59_10]
MKRFFVIVMATLFLSGCGAAARESGYYEHSTMYKSWDHLKFSICGYKSVNEMEVKQSKEEAWWGTTVEGKN